MKTKHLISIENKYSTNNIEPKIRKYYLECDIEFLKAKSFFKKSNALIIEVLFKPCTILNDIDYAPKCRYIKCYQNV